MHSPIKKIGMDGACLLGEVVDIEVHIPLKKDRLDPSDVSSIVIDDHLYIEKLKLFKSSIPIQFVSTREGAAGSACKLRS